jgi:glycosyltransferase involved in cell wall biosynthesis
MTTLAEPFQDAANAPKICIDCSPLLLRSAGVKTYLYHWLTAMRALNPGAMRTFLAPARPGPLDHEGGLHIHALRIMTLLALNRLPEVFCETISPACDVFHVSNQLRRFPVKPALSTTLHDLTAWLVPDCHTAAMIEADRVFAERIRSRCSGIIAVSHNTRNDAIRILGIAPERIRVIYPGIASQYFNPSPGVVEDAVAAYKLPQRYFLFVSTIEPRKNLDSLLTAWEALPASFRAENTLVVVGTPGWRSQRTMQRLRQIAATGSDVLYLGYVPEKYIPGLTAGAQALVYPTLYEGFGFPVAQAMAAGCPVITSDLSSLPEITAGAAFLIDPRSVAQLTGAIQRVGESPDLRNRLRAAGIRQSQKFTWQKSALESMAYFSEIA